MMFLGLFAICIFLLALFDKTPKRSTDNSEGESEGDYEGDSEMNPADNSEGESEVNPTDNSEGESGVNPADKSEGDSERESEMNPADKSEMNPTDKSEMNPTDKSEGESEGNTGIIYEMDPLDAPPIQWITKKSDSDDTPVGKPKHLRTESYEDNKSGLAAIFENVKSKVD
jgi:hypothetical protein